ncbi:MAG: ArsR family transcriptional regulator [Candidatus Dadabacteria bacterium]|nr:MAG: ArsR family transcriptional regulator [Candidatus Dadabacteria bacterium]
MSRYLFEYIGNLATLRVLRALSYSSCHLRELAALTSLSPAGVSDILRRLTSFGLVSEHRHGKRKVFELQVDNQERKYLQEFFRLYEESWLKRRSAEFSLNAQEKLNWMDESLSFFKEVKAKINDTANNS